MARNPSNYPVWLDRGWQPAQICFLATEEAWNRFADKLNLKPADREYHFAHHKSWGYTRILVGNEMGDAIICVALNDNLLPGDPVLVMTTLCHEAVHVVDLILEHMGEREPGIETRAYMTEHVFSGLVEAYANTLGRDKDWFNKGDPSS